MFRTLKLDATRVYLFMEIAFGMFFGMVVVTNSLYEVTVAGLSALQLVLIGTMLEVSTFLFEVPTGIVADVYSRRLSIVIGYVLIGLGFLIEGFFPAFRPILLAQVVWGLGYTFTSGAKQAWITDEIGEESANKLFLRSARLGTYAWLICIGSHPADRREQHCYSHPGRCDWNPIDWDRACVHHAGNGLSPHAAGRS